MDEEQIKTNIIPEDNPELTEPPSTPSMIKTMNRLKETEDRLYFTKKRLNILQSKQSKMFHRSLQQEKRETICSQISEFAQQQKQRKQRYLSMKKLQLQEIKTKNALKKQTHMEKMNDFKTSFIERKRLIHSSAKHEREKNESKIKEMRQKEMVQKKTLRGQMYAAKKERSLNVHEYFRNKKLMNNVSKQQQHKQLEDKIKQKQELIRSLEQEGEDVHCSLETFLLESRLTNDKNPLLMETQPKGFRVKFMTKNHTQVSLQ